MSPSNQTIPEGKPANISCKATGFPKPTLRWTFSEDGDLPQGAVVEYNESRSFLKLKNVSKLMAGTYKCTAKNKANSTTATAALRVLGMFWFYTNYINLYILILMQNALILLNNTALSYWPNLSTLSYSVLNCDAEDLIWEPNATNVEIFTKLENSRISASLI